MSFGNPTNVTGPSLPPDFHKTIARAERDGISLAEATQQIAIESTPDSAVPAELREVRKKQDEIARLQSQLDQEHGAALAVNNRWHALRTTVTNLEAELQLADEQRAALEAHAEDRPALWANAAHHHNHGIGGVLTNYQQVAAARAALESLKPWIDLKTKEHRAAVRERDVFAKDHGIGE